MIANVDNDDDGTIDFEEFLGLMVRKIRETDTEAKLRKCFKVFDRDGHNFITS